MPFSTVGVRTVQHGSTQSGIETGRHAVRSRFGSRFGSRSLRARILVAWVAVIALGVGVAGPADARTRHATPSYYLSLGDSLAYGYQPNLVAAGDLDPTHYVSYAEDYARLDRHLTLVNYGCPGETTATLLTGGCPWPSTALHDSYGAATSQLAAATAFLTAHRGQVSLVTIDIGSNDLLALVGQCQTTATSATALEACLAAGLPATISTIATNYATLLGTIKTLAPSATIVMFNLYNPMALTLPGSDQLVGVVNQALAGIAANAGARVADAFKAINVKADSTVEKASVCLLTWECTSYKNVHPTTLGYDALTWALVVARWER
ncbi:SGNH/GDSL hydrolase family protein [Cellulomonas sp. P24]|uniref:SGNH/GDSL hydrolase family protein n=1 Tax=Cellulomonas sp. P24 TaxID=2885206 RepID=UPI00216B2D69|nr:SGNH/GDSL hydrolase family protein [Cellulomonas sp. P24]MCR6491529.1 SGNH/GDSL hydrolase family protein [Cellulomonas sp. P24]